MNKLLLYIGRWQLSTPILFVVILVLGDGLWQTVVANLIGACIFFPVDKIMFNRSKHGHDKRDVAREG